jgi:hypothetical protein
MLVVGLVLVLVLLLRLLLLHLLQRRRCGCRARGAPLAAAAANLAPPPLPCTQMLTLEGSPYKQEVTLDHLSQKLRQQRAAPGEQQGGED